MLIIQWDYKRHFKHEKSKRTQALSATENCAIRMVEREAKKHPPSVYDVSETVLIRYPDTGNKLVKKRYVLERNLENDLFKDAFSSPTLGKQMAKWISVCNVTSTMREKGKVKKMETTIDKWRQRKKFNYHMIAKSLYGNCMTPSSPYMNI